MNVHETRRFIAHYNITVFSERHEMASKQYREIAMIRTILFSTALVITAPALAQGTATSQTPAQAGAQPAAPQSSTPQNAANAVASIVDTEFPAYDANKDGQLDQSEFSRWMVALKDQEIKATGKTLSPDQVTTWASGAFTTADKDKSTSISKPELIAYLSGGA